MANALEVLDVETTRRHKKITYKIVLSGSYANPEVLVLSAATNPRFKPGATPGNLLLVNGRFNGGRTSGKVVKAASNDLHTLVIFQQQPTSATAGVIPFDIHAAAAYAAGLTGEADLTLEMTFAIGKTA